MKMKIREETNVYFQMLERRLGKSTGIWEVRPGPVSHFTPLLGSGEKSGALAPSRLGARLSFLLPQSSAPLQKVRGLIPRRADGAVHQPGRCSSSPGSQGPSCPPSSCGLSRALQGFPVHGPGLQSRVSSPPGLQGPFLECWLIVNAAQQERKAGPRPETEPRGRRGTSGERAMPLTGR